MAKHRFRTAIMGAAIAFCSGSMDMSPAQDTDEAFELVPGVVVNPNRQVVYIMNKDKGIDAVGIERGNSMWTSRAAAKPLGMKDNLLIAQAEPDAPGSLRVVVLKEQDGETVVSGETGLPESVSASIDETLGGTFVSRAGTLESDALVTWQFSERSIRAVPTEEDAGGLPGRNGGAVTVESVHAPRVESGAYALDLTTGAMSNVHVEEGAAANTETRILVAEERVPEIPGETQYLSADGKHLMTSELTDDDRTWEKYRLTIFDRKTGERVGEFKSHLSSTPFFVAGDRVILETGPYTVRRDGQLVEEPRQIRAVDLQAGKELWKREIRDTTFRGPYPP